jgi:hypothetical protein
LPFSRDIQQVRPLRWIAGRGGELARLERDRDLTADRIIFQPEHAKTGTLHEVPLTP